MRMEDARGNKPKNGLTAIDNQGVASIVPALKPNNTLDLFG